MYIYTYIYIHMYMDLTGLAVVVVHPCCGLRRKLQEQILVVRVERRCQYLYFSTSKASKLSTCRRRYWSCASNASPSSLLMHWIAPTYNTYRYRYIYINTHTHTHTHTNTDTQTHTQTDRHRHTHTQP
jgi:hypothetical protein